MGMFLRCPSPQRSPGGAAGAQEEASDMRLKPNYKRRVLSRLVKRGQQRPSGFFFSQLMVDDGKAANTHQFISILAHEVADHGLSASERLLFFVTAHQGLPFGSIQLRM